MADDEHGKGHAHAEDHGDGGHAAHEEHEEHEGAPEWLISFADNVTLMMGFFVILLAMNMGPKGSASGASQGAEGASAPPPSQPDMVDAAIAIREAFNNPVDVGSPRPQDWVLVKRIRDRQRMQGQDEGPDGRHEESQTLRRGDYHSPAGEVTFSTGAAQMTDAGKASVEAVARYLRGLKLVVEVRGHTSAEEAYDKDDRGMRLAFERSLAVGQALADAGVEWRQIRLVPCGSNERLERHAVSPESHAMNQRAEIIVTDDLVE